ncbi:MAG: DNA/RNA nuclease SfsA [Candidatus Marinimicrobia bacterium]|nr:DNA/RNA nuclease SfsA [Candidatus Neomarinimicrobiota bacterium]
MGSKLRAMKIAKSLIKGVFLERPNRFITIISLGDTIVESHLPDPGRLQELLIPGAIVYALPAPENSERKTKYSTVMVENNGVLISLDTTLPNRFIKHYLNTIPLFADWSIIKAEYTVGNHRIDFLLNDSFGNEVYTEIKSVTFVENKIAKFPDAVTARGRKHVNLLAKLVEDGKRSLVLFVCQRPDANEFRPMWNRDPEFAKALKNAYDGGVRIHCITTNISLKEMTYSNEIPVNLTSPNEA